MNTDPLYLWAKILFDQLYANNKDAWELMQIFWRNKHMPDVNQLLQFLKVAHDQYIFQRMNRIPMQTLPYQLPQSTSVGSCCGTFPCSC